MGHVMDLVVGSCEETGERLSDRLEGTLRGVRHWRVSAHLAGCDRCRAVLDSLTQAVKQLRQLGETGFAPPESASVAGIVVERIRRESG